MVEKLNPPILIMPIPDQIINEGASFNLNLNNHIESPDGQSGIVRFFAELTDGSALPKGLICTTDGLISGIPGKDTNGQYELIIVAENDSGVPFSTKINLTIKERIALADAQQHFTELKSKIWDAIGHDLPLPPIEDFINRPITAEDLYYLLQRFATLTIWDVYNLDSPSELKALQLSGMSPHYHVYDRGSCLVATPKDLYSFDRTLEDGLITARAMAREVYQRNWTIEFGGFDKMARASWVELQLLAAKNNRAIDIVRYAPSPRDMLLFENEKLSKNILGRNV